MIKKTKIGIKNIFKVIDQLPSDNKDLLINYSTSSYALNAENYKTLNLSTYKSKLIVFSNCYSNQQFCSQHKNIQFINSYQKICKIMQNDKSQTTYIYITSNSTQDQNLLRRHQFQTQIATLVKQFIGKVIIEIHPFQIQNFKKQFCFLKEYFQNLFSSKIKYLQQKPKQKYLVFDSSSGDQIYQENTLNLLNQNKTADETVNQVLQRILKTKTKKKFNEKIILATNNPAQTLKKYETLLKETKFYTQSEIQQISNKFNDFCYGECPQALQKKIIYFLKQYGIFYCCKQIQQFKNQVNEKIKYEQKDQQQGSYFKESQFYHYILGFLVENAQQFPIVITNDPLYLLQGRGLTYQYVQIQDSFYQLLKQQKQPMNSLRKIIFRENNANNLKQIYLLELMQIIFYYQCQYSTISPS